MQKKIKIIRLTPQTQGQEDNKAAGNMKIYIIKSRIHYSFGETSEWLNLYAESTKEEAQRSIERHNKQDQESGLASYEEYAIEEIKLF